MKKNILGIISICLLLGTICLYGCDFGGTEGNEETETITNNTDSEEHGSGEEGKQESNKDTKKKEKKSNSKTQKEEKNEEFQNYTEFSLEERKDFVLKKINNVFQNENDENKKNKKSDKNSKEESKERTFHDKVIIIFASEVVEFQLCDVETECTYSVQPQNKDITIKEGDTVVLFNENLEEDFFLGILKVETINQDEEGNFILKGIVENEENLFKDSDSSTLSNEPINFDEASPFDEDNEEDEEKMEGLEGEVKLNDNTFFHTSENASEQDAAKNYYSGLMAIIEPCETSILKTFSVIEEATFGVDFEEILEGQKKTVQKLCAKAQSGLATIEPFRKDETIKKAIIEYFSAIKEYQTQELFDSFVQYVNLITKNGQKADINVDVMTGILSYQTYQNLAEQFGLRKENLKDTGFIVDGENFFLNLSTGAENMEKSLKIFNESVQKFAKRYDATIDAHQFPLFKNRDFIGNIVPASEKKNLTIVGQVSVEKGNNEENGSGELKNNHNEDTEEIKEEKPAFFEGEIYDICGSYTFGKATMYSICLEDTKRKEITSKDIGNLTSLEDFSNVIAIKIAYNNEEVENRSLIDKIFGDDLGKMTQEEFNEKFNFSKSKHLHSITYAGELKLSDLKEGETYKFTFDPLLEKSGKPNITNDLGKNIIVYTYSEGIHDRFQVTPYASYHFPKVQNYSFSNEDAKEIYLMYKSVTTRDLLKIIDPESIVYLAREEINIEQNREGSYFYNNTNQFFNISVTDDSYTSYPNNTFSKEIQPQEIFSCDHAVDSYTITPLTKETTSIIHTGTQKKNTTETTSTNTQKSSTTKTTTKTTNTGATNNNTNNTNTTKKEKKSEQTQDFSTVKVLTPNEVYRDEHFGIQIKNKGKYPGTIVINKVTDKKPDSDFIFSGDNAYMIDFYVSAPEKISQFQLLEETSQTAKERGEKLGQTGENLILIKRACLSTENCYYIMNKGDETEKTQMNHQGFVMNYAGRAIDNMYHDNEIETLTNDKEISDAELKTLSKNRYSSWENYEQKLNKVNALITNTFEIDEDYSFAKIKEESQKDPQQTSKETEKKQTTTKTSQQTTTTGNTKTQTKTTNTTNSITFYTKNLGIYPLSGLQLDEKGNLTDAKKTKEIMQKIGLCGRETRFDCKDGVKRFKKEKVGELFIYSVGKWSWEKNCKGQERTKCYTPSSNVPFFKTKESSKEGYVYLYPADNVKLCVLGTGQNEC